MTNAQIRNLLDSTAGRFFHVTFMKADGTIRTMNARIGVQKGLKGGKSSIEGKAELYGLYDVAKRQYRSLNLGRVMKVQCGDRVFQMGS